MSKSTATPIQSDPCGWLGKRHRRDMDKLADKLLGLPSRKHNGKASLAAMNKNINDGITRLILKWEAELLEEMAKDGSN